MNKPLILCIILLTGCFILTCGCSLKDSSGQTEEIPEDTGSSYVSFSTPIATEDDLLQPTFNRPPDASKEERLYETIYHDTRHYNYLTVPLDCSVERTPFIIDYKAYVGSESDLKEVCDDSGCRVFSKTVPDTNAFLKITVYDRNTNRIIEDVDISPFYKSYQEGRIELLSEGEIHVEIFGNMVMATIDMKMASD